MRNLSQLAGALRDICSDDDGWTPELSWAVAEWVAGHFGASAVSEYIVEARKESSVAGWGDADAVNLEPRRVTPEEAKEKLMKLIPPPYFLIDPAKTAFPDSEEIWWKAVARMLKEGKLLNDKGKPNYEQAMRYWKNMVKAKYGFRPKRTKDQSMTDQIKDKVKTASAAMGKELAKENPKQSKVSKAARLIAVQKTQKKRAKEQEKAQQQQQKSDAAKKGWEKRRGGKEE
jgi:hypothetical protein